MPTLPNSNPTLDPRFPYPTSFKPLRGGSETQKFKYTETHNTDDPGCLNFYGELINPAEPITPICIKFVRQYSKAAHEHCALLKRAPILYGFEKLPGGWLMVVMEKLDPNLYRTFYNRRSEFNSTQYGEIQNALRSCVVDLHKADMVHGDIRGCNFLIHKDDLTDIKLIDFDWAGEVGIVRYPMNVGHIDIARPDDARDGQLVTKEHDLQMITFLF